MKPSNWLIQLQDNKKYILWLLVPIAFLIGSCGRTIDSQPYFVPGEVIVMGDPAFFSPKVDDTFEGLGLTALHNPEDEIELEGSSKIYLYSFEPGNDHTTFLLLDALASEGVTVDPNFYTSISSYNSCGLPVVVNGEPFEVDGSPFEVDGSGQIGNVAEAERDAFDVQWAWDKKDSLSVFLATKVKSMNGAAIAIFDTNPMRSNQGITAPQQIKDQLDTFEVHTNYAHFTDRDDASWLKDHAVFIAGIAHTIAPESEVHFIPVLDDHACGDLFTLIYSMQNFNTDTLNNHFDFIFNLSLGIEHPGTQIQEGDLESTGRGKRFKQVVDFLSGRLDADMISLFVRVLLAPVETLEAVIKEVESSGNLVVAAAGNDSIGPGDVLEPNLPAAFNNVLGVGASTLDEDHACYSNSADIYAPGGDGTESRCLPASASCSDPDCPYGVISWSMFTSTGYRFWSGTSFSTAIVTGLIANPTASSQ